MANKTFDILGLIVEDTVVTDGDSTTGVEITGVNIGSKSYVCAVKAQDLTGIFDLTNNYTVALEVADLVGGAYALVGETRVLSDGTAEIGFTSEQLAQFGDAEFFRITTTKVGSTATGVTLTAFLSVI